MRRSRHANRTRRALAAWAFVTGYLLQACGGDATTDHGGRAGGGGGAAGAAVVAGRGGGASGGGSAGATDRAGMSGAGAGGSSSSTGPGGVAGSSNAAGSGGNAGAPPMAGRAGAGGAAGVSGTDAGAPAEWSFSATCDQCLRTKCDTDVYTKCKRDARCNAEVAAASFCFVTGTHTKGPHDIPPGSPDAWGGFCDPWLAQDPLAFDLWRCMGYSNCNCACWAPAYRSCP